MATDIAEETLCCGICKAVWTDPRTTACGHTFCRACIEKWIAIATSRSGCRTSCPLCRRHPLPLHAETALVLR
ncbi:hypothetical protein LCGC14_2703680, partial [marine sediment metagenome]